jgi:plasmid stabilization system protein ParE
MKYAVNVTARAERDLRALCGDIDAVHSETARKWYRGLSKEILSIEKFPFRCFVTSENKSLRHLLYGHGRNTYRIIYRVSGAQVDILHIRDGARKP